jgi:hypothetical protein
LRELRLRLREKEVELRFCGTGGAKDNNPVQTFRLGAVLGRKDADLDSCVGS